MPHKPHRNFHNLRFSVLPALGLSMALAVQSADAAPDQMIVLPPGLGADDASLLILPGEHDPESLGTDDGTFDSGGGGCESECEGDYDYEEPSHPENPADGAGVSVGGTAAASAAAAAAVAQFVVAGEFCSVFNPLDRIDCLRDEYARIAKLLPNTGAYAPMRRALQTAVAELSQIVRNNGDTQTPPVRRRVVRASESKTTATPIRRISPARAAVANAQAEVVLDKLATTLLRSAPSIEAQRVNYERAAQAVNSAKVLLRST